MKKPAKKKAVKKTVKKTVKKRAKPPGPSASKLINARIKDLGDWRGKTLASVRALMKDAVPGVIEEWKWGIPVWSQNGIITTGEVYKTAVKMTFAKGASLADPARLFNASLDGNTRRAIDIREGEKINEKALKALFRAAADLNAAAAKTPKKKA
jgi:hypothetical protein